MSLQQFISARKMSLHDLDTVFLWRNHPSIRGFMLTQQEITMAEHRAWFERSDKDKTKVLLVIEDANRPVGCVIFSNVSFEGVVDWGFYAAPDSAPGTGRKICETALNIAFHELKVYKVTGRVLDFNEASIRTHLRLGFTQEANLREHFLINDKYHDLLVFSLLSCDWQNYNVHIN